MSNLTETDRRYIDPDNVDSITLADLSCGDKIHRALIGVDSKFAGESHWKEGRKRHTIITNDETDALLGVAYHTNTESDYWTVLMAGTRVCVKDATIEYNNTSQKIDDAVEEADEWINHEIRRGGSGMSSSVTHTGSLESVIFDDGELKIRATIDLADD